MKRRAFEPKVEVIRVPEAPVGSKENPDGLAAARRWAQAILILRRCIARNWDVLMSKAKTGEEHQEVIIMDQENYVPAELCWRQLSISPRSWYRLVQRYQIPKYVFNGSVRYKLSEVEAVIAKCRKGALVEAGSPPVLDADGTTREPNKT